MKSPFQKFSEFFTGKEVTEDGKPAEVKIKCTILAIDDEQDVLDTIKPVMQAEGFKILTANTGVKGLDMLRYASEPFDVILLDYRMPRFTGLDTLNHLRKLSPKSKIIAVTGELSERLPDEYKNGVDGFLAKPFMAADLVKAVKDAMTGKGTPPAAK